MATFKATLFDTDNKLAVTANGNTITITDYSNYTDGTDSGHAQSDFSFIRIIKFTLPDNSYYIMATTEAKTYFFPTANQIISAPSDENVFPIVDTFNYTSGDGVYYAKLYVVPTLNINASYIIGNCVYNVDNKIYKALNNNPNTDIANYPYDWELITDLDTLPAKYISGDYFSVTCDSQICLTRLISKGICESTEIGCNYEKLFKNKYFVFAQKLNLLLKYTKTLSKNAEWEMVSDCINLMKSICCCNG